MKIKVINQAATVTRDSKLDVAKVRKNLDRKLHPFERAREYTRAIVAVKLDRVFAKPFIGALTGHSDGIYCSSTNPRNLVSFVSGAATAVHCVGPGCNEAVVSVRALCLCAGVAVAADGEHFFSCGDDKTIKQWRLVASAGNASSEADSRARVRQARARRRRQRRAPRVCWHGSTPSRTSTTLVVGALCRRRPPSWTCWTTTCSEPVHSFAWAPTRSTRCASTRPSRTSWAARGTTGACASTTCGRTRPFAKSCSAWSNALALNPREPFNFW